MTAYNNDVDQIQASGDASAADKLTFRAPFDCLIQRWGVIAGTAITGGAMDVALDIIPRAGGTRVNGSVSGGFDVAGGSMTNIDVALGTMKYHEPKFDPSGAVSPGTGVNRFGNQLMLKAGDTAVIEVTGAGTGGANSAFFIEYRSLQFQGLGDANLVKVAS